MGLPSEGMAFPLYEFFMNTAPWNKFDYFTGARGRDAPRRYNRDTTRQARVNWKRYHTHAAGEYNRARSLVVHRFPERVFVRHDPDCCSEALLPRAGQPMSSSTAHAAA